MSNLIVDGFGHYGTGQNSTPVRQAMLAGAWAAIDSSQWVGGGISTLPWDLSNDDTYMFFAGIFGADGARRVLPSTYSTIIVSMYFAISQIPANNGCNNIISLRDNANARIIDIWVTSTGAIFAGTNSGSQVVLAASAGPVLVAETATHIEIKATPNVSTGTLEVWANGTQVINATGMAYANGNAVAQVTFGNGGGLTNSDVDLYWSHLIVRDTSGSFNNDITGDRKVATLLVNNDDTAQGWTKRPLHRFGNGILDLTADDNSGVFVGITTGTDLGDVDFTWEGQVRFQNPVSGSNKAHIFGKWDEANNDRSYQLYKGGPSLNNGHLVFRYSTDGTNTTVVEIFNEPWEPAIGIWYHLAVERVSGVHRMYVDGVQLGTDVTDGAVYYAGNARTALGVQTAGATGVANTGFPGWMDEWRCTKGSFRYDGNFTPPSDVFPRGTLNDSQWSDVEMLCGFDAAVVADDSGFSRSMSAVNSAAAITPDDGGDNYEVLDKLAPNDDTFIEAALLSATGTLTLTANPSNGETVTVGTKTGPAAAVYQFVTSLSAAFDVLIGSTAADSLDNLNAAINLGAGSGSLYHASTTANLDVTSERLPTLQIKVTALTAGAAGNSIASTETLSNGAWDNGTTLTGGADIPGVSEFGFQNLPAGASVVDSVTIVRRSWKTDAGDESTRVSLIGPSSGVQNGATVFDTTVPTLYHDTIEVDPDNPSNALTPTAVNDGLIRIDRLT